MKQIEITSERLTEGTELLEKAGAGASLLLPADGGGILLPECIQSGERYLTFFLTVQEEHSMASVSYTHLEKGRKYDIDIRDGRKSAGDNRTVR